ncbi:MAG: hypothetical protein ABI671_16210 [Burkholderiales bacterium]
MLRGGSRQFHSFQPEPQSPDLFGETQGTDEFDAFVAMNSPHSGTATVETWWDAAETTMKRSLARLRFIAQQVHPGPGEQEKTK